nr:flippase-like domain-containing protein [Anaerolineae bacterium]
MKLKRWQTILAGLIISAVFLYLSLRRANLDAMLEAFRSARYQYILLSLLVVIFSVFIRAIRWSVLTQGRLSIGDAFWLFNIGFLVNNLLPARIGEISRAMLAGQRPAMHFSSALSSIVVERLFDMVAVVVMLGIVLIVLPLPSWATGAGALMGAIAITGIIILAIAAQKPMIILNAGSWILAILPRVNREKAREFLTPFVEGLGGVADLKTFILGAFWTAVAWLLSGFGGWLMLLAFWEAVPLAIGNLAIAAAGLGIAVPAAPSGVGPFEAAVIGVLTAANYEADTSRSYAFTLHAANFLVTTVLGLIGLLREGVSFGQITRDAQTAKKEASTQSVPSPDIMQEHGL